MHFNVYTVEAVFVWPSLETSTRLFPFQKLLLLLTCEEHAVLPRHCGESSLVMREDPPEALHSVRDSSFRQYSSY